MGSIVIHHLGDKLAVMSEKFNCTENFDNTILFGYFMVSWWHGVSLYQASCHQTASRACDHS